MFKVVIADDHYPVLEYLKSSIPWKQLNLELCTLCINGEEAWEAYQLYSPDIIITDIGMPLLDGLELIKRVRQQNTQLKVIILSCHEEFHYAQKAVKLNVNDYLLKENLHKDSLTSTLSQIIQELQEQHISVNKQKHLQHVVDKNLFAIRARFICKFLEQPVWNTVDWAEDAEKIGIEMLPNLPYFPIVFFPERIIELESRFGGEINLQFVIDNALQEIIQYERSILLVPNKKQYILLIPFPVTIKRNFYEEIRTRLKQIQFIMQKHLRIRISCYYGEACSDFIELKKQLKLLLEAKTFRFYAGEEVIAKIHPICTSKDDIFLHYSQAIQEMKTCILHGHSDQISDIVSYWGEIIHRNLYPIESVKSWILKITMELELKYTVMQNFFTNFDSEIQQRNVNSIDTLEHLLHFLENFLNEKSRTIKNLRNQNVRREIIEAQRYVLAHIQEKLSMEEMAHRLNLNPSHFSRLFKQETGSTFVEFVTSVKIDHAKELLHQSDATVNEIAERLGYEHTSYFIKLFRNYVGMSPNEYRKVN